MAPRSHRRRFEAGSVVAILSLAVATLGCNDQKIGIVARPPSVTITSPAANSTFYEGQTIEFQALVEPARSDDDPTALTHRWVSGNETMCEDEPSAPTARLRDFGFSVVGLKAIQVTASNSTGERSTATLELEIIDNTPPTVEIAPDEGIYVATDELLVVSALVGDLEEDPQDRCPSPAASTACSTTRHAQTLRQLRRPHHPSHGRTAPATCERRTRPRTGLHHPQRLRARPAVATASASRPTRPTRTTRSLPKCRGGPTSMASTRPTASSGT